MTDLSGQIDQQQLANVRREAPDRPPIRLGIIGTGLAVKRLHWPGLARMPERFRVVGFANRTRATAEEFAALAGLSMDGYVADYRALLDRPDVEAVLVAVPIPLLYQVASDCLAAGKHLICEKPPGASEDEALRFAALVRAYPDRAILMAEHFFYRDELRLARSLVEAGEIGEPRMLVERIAKYEVPVAGSFPSTPWRTQPAYPGGTILDGGVHSVAGIRLLGGDISTLYARTEWLNSTFAAPSALTMTFGFASGMSGQYFYGSFDTPLLDEVADTRLYGTAGALVVRRNQVKMAHPDGEVRTFDFAESDPFANEFRNFHEALVAGAPVVGTVDQSVRNMLVTLRALESAERGAAVDLRDEGRNQPATGVPLWRPLGASGLFDGLATQVTRTVG
jgi:predicted dehydrogenase